jgi:hypothetical protein
MSTTHTVFWLALAVVSICTYAMVEQYRYIPIVQMTEDSCDQYYGVYELYRVDPELDYVICKYK